MNNKSKRNLIFLGIILLLALWYYFAAFSAPLVVAPPPPSSKVSASPPASASQSPANNSTNNNAGAPTPEQMRAAHEAEANRERGIWNMLFLTPITFYGKVVDQTATPVEGAKAILHPGSDIGGGSKDYERYTDANGLFSISGIHGIALTVGISKDGYYTLPESYGNFGYVKEAGGLPPYTNPNNPAIFILRKMGETEPLIKVFRDVRIPINGTPTQMILATGMTYHVTNGDIQVESWANIPPIGSIYKSYDWRCKITILNGGGIQPSTGGEFDFTAPEDGYQPSDEIDMPTTDPKWSSNQSRNYFLKLANGNYARINFIIAVDNDSGFEITSYLNPVPGHRNLEFDPTKQINKK